RPVLDYMTDESKIRLNSEPAVALLLGTCAVESEMGQFIRQYPLGPARGVFQLEERSFDDLWSWIQAHSQLLVSVSAFVSRSPWPLSSQVCGNLYLATALCRLYYYRVPKPLPGGRDPSVYGAYWKAYYNTPEGSGTIDRFVQAWTRHAVGDCLQIQSLG